MQEMSAENQDTVANNGAGQDSVDYNGPDGDQDPTQWGHGPETIEFRAMVSANAFFNWAAQFTSAASDVYSLLNSAPSDTAASDAVSDYFDVHNGGNTGLDSGLVGDIVVTAYHSAFGSLPTLDLYSVWFTGDLHVGTGDNHQLGTQAGDFTIVGAEGSDLAQFQQALDYLHRSPQAAALLEWAAVHHVTVNIVHDGFDRFDPVHNAIYWDPLAGLQLQNGHIQSPALGLIHEFGHAYGDQPGVPILHYAPSDPNYGYRSVQEHDDIINTETPIAISLGEFVRFSNNDTDQHVIHVDYSTYHY